MHTNKPCAALYLGFLYPPCGLPWLKSKKHWSIQVNQPITFSHQLKMLFLVPKKWQFFAEPGLQDSCIEAISFCVAFLKGMLAGEHVSRLSSPVHRTEHTKYMHGSECRGWCPSMNLLHEHLHPTMVILRQVKLHHNWQLLNKILSEDRNPNVLVCLATVRVRAEHH